MDEDRLTVRVDPVMKAAFKKACAGTGKSMSWVVEDLIFAWGLKERESAMKALGDLYHKEKQITEIEGESGFKRLIQHQQARLDLFSDFHGILIQKMEDQKGGE
jgi:hypothetical protein